MSFELKESDIRKIAGVLGVEPTVNGRAVRYELENRDQGRKLALEIYNGIAIGKRKGTLVSVYTPTAHLQLHFCTGYVISEMLGELTFVGEAGGKLSGLTVEREGGCSLYANVDREILSGDFTTLGPEVMMSGIALSLTEEVLPRVSEPTGKEKSLKARPVRKTGRAKTKGARRAIR
ncbi:MAG: hypothetical protein HYW57_07500 [Ignavibacteriales bacterium]|nr:hypothetical protein [Ignavibacteriales bacterium]